MALCS